LRACRSMSERAPLQVAQLNSIFGSVCFVKYT
jgi:hypothetical protein